MAGGGFQDPMALHEVKDRVNNVANDVKVLLGRPQVSLAIPLSTCFTIGRPVHTDGTCSGFSGIPLFFFFSPSCLVMEYQRLACWCREHIMQEKSSGFFPETRFLP